MRLEDLYLIERERQRQRQQVQTENRRNRRHHQRCHFEWLRNHPRDLILEFWSFHLVVSTTSLVRHQNQRDLVQVLSVSAQGVGALF